MPLKSENANLSELKKSLRQLADPTKAKILSRFFKTGKGEYGEGDRFLGITVPLARKVAKKYNSLSLADIKKLLTSKIHEERLVALLVLVEKFEKEQKAQEEIYRFYLKNTKYINSWDLVDLTAPKIIGVYLLNKPKDILFKLAESKNLWERRIAIVSTFYFIKENNFQETLAIAKVLLRDPHDLIHKAVGWMLREVGKRSFEKEEKFLRLHYKKMPRTMLRYAIERYPENLRRAYLEGKA